MEENNKQMLYSNTAQISGTIYDFTMKFAQNSLHINPVNEERIVQTNELVTIAMSPQHFKTFVEIAKNHVDAYEREFGTIINKKESDNKEATEENVG